MRELLSGMERKPWTICRGLALVDTCFLIDELRHHRGAELPGLAMLSFNAEELVHVSHHLPDDVKQQIRHFFKGNPLLLVDVPVHPGDRDGEHAFVNAVDAGLLQRIPDASDAVLLAAALRTRSAVLTKDKHHLFTATLNNYAEGHGVMVFKELKDWLAWRA